MYTTRRPHNNQEEARIVIVPIEKIYPGIEDRYRQMLKGAEKRGEWPPKKTEPLADIQTSPRNLRQRYQAGDHGYGDLTNIQRINPKRTRLRTQGLERFKIPSHKPEPLEEISFPELLYRIFKPIGEYISRPLQPFAHYQSAKHIGKLHNPY